MRPVAFVEVIMLRKSILSGLIAAALSLQVGFALAADPPPAQQQLIYGSELMTDAERIEYRNRMRAATTAEARERIRLEHHERMKARAAERGVTLPESPPDRGMGRGMGPGGGMGSGGGMGPGGGR
jgi:hypothetical protein